MVLEEVVVVAVGVLLLAAPTFMYPQGAPFGVCSTMTPGHGAQGASPSPYNISVSTTIYKPGDTITVTVAGGTFMGIMMQVRKVGTNIVHGSWSELANDTRTQTCTNTADTVTHQNINPKQGATFTWTPPDDVTDPLHVVATVAQEKIRWWKGLTSVTLSFDIPTTTTSTSTSTTTTTTTTTTTPTTTSTTTTTTIDTAPSAPSPEGSATPVSTSVTPDSPASSIFLILMAALTAALALPFH